MPAKKARGKSKASRATGKTKRSARKSTRKKSAAGAQRTKATSPKKTARRRSPGVVKSMKEMAGAVMAAAAAGALKGAVTAVLPPVRKAAGITEESRETKGSGEVPRSQDQRDRQNDTT